MPAAIVVPRQRDALIAQLVGHACTSDETDVATSGKKPSADIATNRAGTVDKDLCHTGSHVTYQITSALR
jgi:hypothetical protein